MEPKIYSGKELVLEAQKRLALMHNVEHNYVVGKNKIIFKLNGSDVYVLKHREKTTGAVKTTVECDYCFPTVLYQDSKDMFSEEDLEKTVVALDRYFINEVLGLSPKLAICNPYYYLKEGLKPFFRSSDEYEEDFILHYLASEADCAESMNSALPDKNSIILLFLADSPEGKKLIMVDIGDFGLTILIFDTDGQELSIPDEDDEIIEVALPYAETPDLALAIEGILTGYDNIRMCSAKITPYLEPEKQEEETEE